jgi:hypothetical protein
MGKERNWINCYINAIENQSGNQEKLGLNVLESVHVMLSSKLCFLCNVLILLTPRNSLVFFSLTNKNK